MSVSADTFRGILRRYATGVVVITASAGGRPAGLTATSLASVSLDPPLLSFAVSATASAWPSFAAAGSVVVKLPRRRPAPHRDPVRHQRDRPVRRADRVVAADLRLVDAAVTAAPATAPLVYHAGAYGTVSPAAVSRP